MIIRTKRFYQFVALLVGVSALVRGSTVSAADDGSIRAPSQAQQAADTALTKRFMEELLHGPNLRLRVLFGKIFSLDGDAPFGTTAVPIDELAESARGETDPVVLAMLVEPCANDRLRPKPSCDALDFAKRLTVADTPNQVAWLIHAATLRGMADKAGSEEAFERASRAPQWREYTEDSARTVAAAIPTGLSPWARRALLVVAITVPNGFSGFSSVWSALLFHCKAPRHRDACIRILDTIDRDGSTSSRRVAVATARRLGLDPAQVDARQTAIDALDGASLRAAGWLPSLASHDAGILEEIRFLERRIARGESGHQQELLKGRGIGEAESAGAYRRAMSASRERAKAELAEQPPAAP